MSFAATGTFLAANASWIVPSVIAGGSAALGYLGDQQKANSAQNAGNTQANYADQGISVQNSSMDAIKSALSPYMTSGTNALSGQNDLLGLNGDESQQKAISSLQSGAQFQALNKTGGDAILSNAAATGGLRGGNVQGALATNSQNVLSNLINQQFSNLGSLSSLGLNATNSYGTASQNNANQVSALLQQKGAALAGKDLSSFNPYASASSALGNAVGAYSAASKLM
jgi:hypothetical protein